jgi:hypothetical protein
MEDTLICGKAAWRRENATHHYVGSISGSDEGLRLTGRDPATGIRVTLLIPPEEIEGVRASESWDERVVGEVCVVLELAFSTPILLREIAAGPLDPGALARRIARVVRPPALALAD